MATLLPKLGIIVGDGEKITPQAIFRTATPAPVWLEIGFGGGEHLAAQAKLHPDISFIGCEPFVNGIASLLDHLDRDGIGNVRIFGDDARRLLDALPAASLDRCFILFADPWPKKRHAERRFVGADTIARLARTLKPGGLLRLASDHPVLVDWMRQQMAAQTVFSCVHDAVEPPPDWIATRYQEKAVKAGRVPVFMDFCSTGYRAPASSHHDSSTVP